MSTYAIGDVQGCFDQLQALLNKIAFNPKKDQLWFVGDLVNRGPKSLEVLRFVKSLGNRAITVLGNHDIHLLARHYAVRKAGRDDSLDEILNAPDVEELMQWLRYQPLVHYNSHYLMVHAGVAPMWSIDQVLSSAKEVERQLQQRNPAEFLHALFSKQIPILWRENLQGMARWRCIVNYLTRIRFCDVMGCLNFSNKSAQPDPACYHWFRVPNRKTQDIPIIFGHWAALEGKTNGEELVYALDTGCVWGKQLTAMCLEQRTLISVEGVRY